MGAVIDLSRYRAYFQTTSDEVLRDIEQLRPHFFADGTEFSHNYWYLRGASKEQRAVSFETPIAPGVMLTDEPELLYTIKLATVLVATIPGKELGKVGVQGIPAFVKDTLNLIRLLRFKYNLRYISSLNKHVADQILRDYRERVVDRLQVKSRISEFVENLSREELQEFYVFASRRKPDFNVSEMALRIGISSRSPQAFPVLMTHFKDKNGFFVKRPQRKYLKLEQDEDEAPRTSDTIRKEVQNIRKFFAVLARFGEMFHELQRPEDEFFADVSADKYSKTHGACGKRTKNIPREVMFKLMDRAIRWVVDYSDELLVLRDRASAQYNWLLTGEHRGGSEQNRRHYASKQMRRWLTANPMELFADSPGAPYPITGFDSDFKASRSNKGSISKEQIEQAQALIQRGMTQQSAAKYVGVSKASLSRILNDGWAEDGLGLDKVLHCYLPTACLLVIYCFTGRRQIEIESLQAECCVESSNGPYICLYSAKVDQQYDYFPVTKLVARAVRILEQLSEPVRSGDSQSLLQVPTLQGGHFQFWQSNKMNEFAALVDANDADGESKKWVFSEHQFRRFFAQTYFYKYDAGDLPALSWHMRHSGFSMTEVYLTDEAFGEVYDEVMAEKVADLVTKGSEGLEQIQKDLKALIENLELQGEKRTERLKKRVKEIGLIMRFVPDGICFGDTVQFKERSQCLTKGEIQISSAKPGTCKGCPNLCSFEHPQDAQSVVEISKSPMLQKLQEMAS